MSARQQLIQDLANQPDNVAGLLLTYLHSLPSYISTEKPQQPSTENHWDTYWSKIYGSCQGMEWDEPAEQKFEVREEW